MKLLRYFALIASCVACAKDDPAPAPHPLIGDWKIRNIESSQYLLFGDYAGNPAFDIGRGNMQVITLVAGPKAGQYYMRPQTSADVYLSLNGAVFTYIKGTTFSGSDADLFSFKPIHNGSDRYYVQSVADTTKYLVACYDCYGRATTLTFGAKGGDYWDQIRAFEKP